MNKQESMTVELRMTTSHQFSTTYNSQIQVIGIKIQRILEKTKRFKLYYKKLPLLQFFKFFQEPNGLFFNAHITPSLM